MAEYVADFAPDNLPDISYLRVSAGQLPFLIAAMELPEHQANFQISFLPIETPEQRKAAAEEWAGYEQAKGQVAARARGAFLVVDGKDRSPQYFLDRIEDKDGDSTWIPYAPFVTAAVTKIVRLNPDADEYDIWKAYYEPDKE